MLPPLTDRARGERLQRVMADAGIAARRECEAMVLDGRVCINGERVSTLPLWVHPELDLIEVDGRPVSTEPQRVLYIMLHKPARTLSAAEDEPGAARVTVTELVQHPSGARLYPVGRLDFDATGLLLLTNDGELANKLTHPRYGIAKTYLVVVKGRIDEGGVRALEQNIFEAEEAYGRLAGATRIARVRIEIFAREPERTTLAITLGEGRSRQVRQILSDAGHPVKKLERVAFGPLTLSGLGRGQWRELTRDEVRALRDSVKAKRVGAEPGEGPKIKSRFKTGPRSRPTRPGGPPARARKRTPGGPTQARSGGVKPGGPRTQRPGEARPQRPGGAPGARRPAKPGPGAARPARPSNRPGGRTERGPRKPGRGRP